MFGMVLMTTRELEALQAQICEAKGLIKERDDRIIMLMDKLLVKEQVPLSHQEQQVLDQDNIRKLVETGGIFDEVDEQGDAVEIREEVYDNRNDHKNDVGEFVQ